MLDTHRVRSRPYTVLHNSMSIDTLTEGELILHCIPEWVSELSLVNQRYCVLKGELAVARTY